MSNLEQPFRSDAAAALERVARLQGENAQLRDALARASRSSGSGRERRARTRRKVRFVIGALALVALGATALLGRRAPPASAAPPAMTIAQVQAPPLPPIGPALAAFDRDAADRALAAVDVQVCADSAVHYVDGLNEGTITVAFSPDGRADGASLKSAAFDGSAVGGCIVKQFQGLHVPPFSGITNNYVTRSFRVH